MAVLVRKLALAADLSDEDLDAVVGSVARIQDVPAHSILIDEGQRPEHVHVVLEGFAYRYKVLPDGGRQIMAWLLPGDFCDLHVALLGEMDHTVSTVSPSRIGRIPRDQVERIIDTSPALSRALWWSALVDAAILREWVVNLGRRPAEARMAHLFCELHARLTAVGLTRGDTVKLPLTQSELADTIGVSPVHVNRILQSLREKKLIAWNRKSLGLEDAAALRELAQFDPNYLHLKRRPSSRTMGAREAPRAPETRPPSPDY